MLERFSRHRHYIAGVPSAHLLITTPLERCFSTTVASMLLEFLLLRCHAINPSSINQPKLSTDADVSIRLSLSFYCSSYTSIVAFDVPQNVSSMILQLDRESIRKLNFKRIFSSKCLEGSYDGSNVAERMIRVAI